MKSLQLNFEDENQLSQWAAIWAKSLRVDDIILLVGPLGAGKTTLVRAILRSFGYTDVVRSPSFNLAHVYASVPPVAHFDLYRLSSDSTEKMPPFPHDLQELMENRVSFIEWPERIDVGLLPPIRAEIRIAFFENGRHVEISDFQQTSHD